MRDPSTPSLVAEMHLDAAMSGKEETHSSGREHPGTPGSEVQGTGGSETKKAGRVPAGSTPKHPKGKAWIATCWLAEPPAAGTPLLLASNAAGQVTVWRFSIGPNGTCLYPSQKKLSPKHSRLIFSVSAVHVPASSPLQHGIDSLPRPSAPHLAPFAQCDDFPRPLLASPDLAQRNFAGHLAQDGGEPSCQKSDTKQAMLPDEATQAGPFLNGKGNTTVQPSMTTQSPRNGRLLDDAILAARTSATYKADEESALKKEHVLISKRVSSLQALSDEDLEVRTGSVPRQTLPEEEWEGHKLSNGNNAVALLLPEQKRRSGTVGWEKDVPLALPDGEHEGGKAGNAPACARLLPDQEHERHANGSSPMSHLPELECDSEVHGNGNISPPPLLDSERMADVRANGSTPVPQLPEQTRDSNQLANGVVLTLLLQEQERDGYKLGNGSFRTLPLPEEETAGDKLAKGSVSPLLLPIQDRYSDKPASAIVPPLMLPEQERDSDELRNVGGPQLPSQGEERDGEDELAKCSDQAAALPNLEARCDAPTLGGTPTALGPDPEHGGSADLSISNSLGPELPDQERGGGGAAETSAQHGEARQGAGGAVLVTIQDGEDCLEEPNLAWQRSGLVQDANETARVVPTPDVDDTQEEPNLTWKRSGLVQDTEDVVRVVTTSMDRSVVVWEGRGNSLAAGLKACKKKWGVTGLGGAASCLALAPWGDRTAVAVGCGDGTIRTVLAQPVSDDSHQGSSPSDGKREISLPPLHWHNIPTKVTALTWHPTNAALLVFGCANGSIGVLHVQHSTVNACSIRHRGPVTTFCWCGGTTPGDPVPHDGTLVPRGPDAPSWRNPGAERGGPQLLSLCADSVVLAWRFGGSAADATEPAQGNRRRRGPAPAPPGLEPLAPPFGGPHSTATITAIAAAPDAVMPSPCVSVGYMDGGVGLVGPGAGRTWRAETQPVRVGCGAVVQLAWASMAGSKGAHLAAVLQDGTAAVLAVQYGGQQVVLSSPAALGTDAESFGRAHVIGWNPGDPAELAVGSAKGLVQVWRYETNSWKSTLPVQQHSLPIQALAWVPTAPGTLVSASDDQSVRTLNTALLHASSEPPPRGTPPPIAGPADATAPGLVSPPTPHAPKELRPSCMACGSTSGTDEPDADARPLAGATGPPAAPPVAPGPHCGTGAFLCCEPPPDPRTVADHDTAATTLGTLPRKRYPEGDNPASVPPLMKESHGALREGEGPVSRIACRDAKDESNAPADCLAECLTVVVHAQSHGPSAGTDALQDEAAVRAEGSSFGDANGGAEIKSTSIEGPVPGGGPGGEGLGPDQARSRSANLAGAIEAGAQADQIYIRPETSTGISVQIPDKQLPLRAPGHHHRPVGPVPEGPGRKKKGLPTLGARPLLPALSATEGPPSDLANGAACTQLPGRVAGIAPGALSQKLQNSATGTAHCAAEPHVGHVEAEHVDHVRYVGPEHVEHVGDPLLGAVTPRDASLALRDHADVILEGAPDAANARHLAAHQAAALHMWRGDVGAALATVIAADALTADFVSLSVSAGRSAWVATTRAYATKLEQQGELHMAALHLIAGRGCVRRNGLVSEGGGLKGGGHSGDCRLVPQDPTLQSLRRLWAAQLESEGFF
eukprot:jgi/Botrbrau1/8055/Bobra.13_2s0024.1